MTFKEKITSGYFRYPDVDANPEEQEVYYSRQDEFDTEMMRCMTACGVSEDFATMLLKAVDDVVWSEDDDAMPEFVKKHIKNSETNSEAIYKIVADVYAQFGVAFDTNKCNDLRFVCDSPASSSKRIKTLAICEQTCSKYPTCDLVSAVKEIQKTINGED